MLACALAAAVRRRDVTTFRPVFVEPGELVEDPTVTVIDELDPQLEQLVRGRSPREDPPDDAIERVLDGCEPCAFGAWVFYPWNRRLVHVLPEPLHRELRLDRNRYAITEDEQQRLTGLCIAVAGLSVGRAVVTTMAHEGIGASCGWPTSTCSTSRTSTGSAAASPTSASARSCWPRARSPSSTPTSTSSRSPMASTSTPSVRSSRAPT
jgi:hypothetical protein